MKRVAIAAEGDGSSSWLTALSLEDFGFSLSKGIFQHAVHLWYGWTPPRLPSLCVCGHSSTIVMLTRSFSGNTSHELRDLLRELLDETCTNVCLEPILKPIDGEQLCQSTNTARLDIEAGGFWSANGHECPYYAFGYFTPMHAHTATAPWNNSTERMCRTNVVALRILIVFKMWTEEPLCLWRSLPQEVLVLRQPHSSSGWLTSCPRIGKAATVRLWVA